MITIEDRALLKASHFLDSEIDGLANATDPDGKSQPLINLSGGVWQNVLKSRQEWYNDKINKGWTEEEIERELRAYYDRDKHRSPYDFLKAEYRPRKKISYLTSLSAKKRAAIEAELEQYGIKKGD